MKRKQIDNTQPFLSFQRDLREIARDILKDESDAEDVVQEVWISTIRNYTRGGKPIVNYKAFLKTATKRKCFDFIKRKKAVRRGRGRVDSLDRVIAEGEDGEQLTLADTIPDDSPDPQDAYIRIEWGRAVYMWVGKLSMWERITLNLSAFEGLSIKEIAKLTGKAQTAVRQNIHRAQEHMRQFRQGAEEYLSFFLG